MSAEKPKRRFGGWLPLVIGWSCMLADPFSRKFALISGLVIMAVGLVMWIVIKIATVRG